MKKVLFGCWLVLCVVAYDESHAQTIVVTPASDTSYAPSVPTVTWTCPAGAISASGLGNWSGAKAVSGTQVLGAFPAGSHKFDIACVMPGTATSNKADITWINAIKNTDDSSIPATCPAGVANCGRLVNTKIEYGSCTGTAFGTKVGEITTAFPGTSVTVNSLVTNTYCFRGFHTNDLGAISSSSNIVTKTVAAPANVTLTASAAWIVRAVPVPLPPTVAVDQTAYEIKANAKGTLVATRIGIVPDGTECSSEHTQKIGTTVYALVPRASVDLVNWPSNTKLADVWAKCS